MPEQQLAHYFLSQQQGTVYVHDVKTCVYRPNYARIFAIMMHDHPFMHHRMGETQTSFVTLEVDHPELKRAASVIAEAVPRFSLVEAYVTVESFMLKPEPLDKGIVHTRGKLVDINMAVMKCRV